MSHPVLPPKVYLFSESSGAVVIRTHDVDVARAAVQDHLIDEHGFTADELDDAAAYLLEEPHVEYGRWILAGSWSVEERGRTWSTCDSPGPGISRAVVWYDL